MARTWPKAVQTSQRCDLCLVNELLVAQLANVWRVSGHQRTTKCPCRRRRLGISRESGGCRVTAPIP